jgi:acetyl-CoA C-acetyltransferase
MVTREVVILSLARTPIGTFQGCLAEIPASHLGGVAIRAAVAQSGIPAEQLGGVVMGCVLPAGQGQAPARQAAHHAGLARSVGATTVNKMCGSGLEAVAIARNMILAGAEDAVVAGGMESMTLAPYILPKGRAGLRMGHGEVLDSMITDGLWDPYGHGHMGNCGELCARENKISREEQDAYAAESFRRARQAQSQGKFLSEITPVEIPQRKGPPKIIDQDEGPGRTDPGKIPSLRPAFAKDGTITAGNASQISDGAAALVVADAAVAEACGARPLAVIRGVATHAQEPEWFTTAPAAAIKRLLETIGWKTSDVDLWEINEAFAVVALINNRLLGLDPQTVNIHGGAIALGHPIGASGARVLVTLLAALADTGGRRGVAALCIGGGEGIAMAVERV